MQEKFSHGHEKRKKEKDLALLCFEWNIEVEKCWEIDAHYVLVPPATRFISSPRPGLWDPHPNTDENPEDDSGLPEISQRQWQTTNPALAATISNK